MNNVPEGRKLNNGNPVKCHFKKTRPGNGGIFGIIKTLLSSVLLFLEFLEIFLHGLGHFQIRILVLGVLWKDDL